MNWLHSSIFLGVIAVIRLLINVFDVGGLLTREFGPHIILYLQLGFARTMASF